MQALRSGVGVDTLKKCELRLMENILGHRIMMQHVICNVGLLSTN